MRIAIRPGIALAALLACTAALARPPGVVTSIAPVHSLAAAVMDGIGEPHLIVRGFGSPHTWQLRPSDARALESASLVVWIGPALELFLQRPLSGLAGDAETLTLQEAEGMTLHPARGAGNHDHDDDGGEAGHGDDSPDIDPHLWLDTDNAVVIVDAVAQALSRLDSANASRYAANASRVNAALATMDAEIRTQLEPVAGVPFLVLHDAYQYFERHYDLSGAGAITIGPERMPGARRLAELRGTIRERGVRCLFAEPQFSSRLADILVEEAGLRTAVLDPIGAGLEPGPGLYEKMMRANARSVASCLGP